MRERILFYEMIFVALLFSDNLLAQQIPAPTNPERLAQFSSEQKHIRPANDPVIRMLESLSDGGDPPKEIELLDTQLEALNKKTMERSVWARDHRNDYKDEEEFIRAGYAKALNDAKEILLPHQMAIIEELAFKKAKNEYGLSGLLLTDWFQERLGISQEQAKRIQERAVSEEKKFKEAVQNAKRKGEEAILGELTSEQRKKLSALLENESKQTESAQSSSDK